MAELTDTDREMIEQPEALAYAPATVRRLQRLRDMRLEARGRVWGRAG